MYWVMEQIVNVLCYVMGIQFSVIYDKSVEILFCNYSENIKNVYVWGEGVFNEVLEYGYIFQVDWEMG